MTTTPQSNADTLASQLLASPSIAAPALASALRRAAPMPPLTPPQVAQALIAAFKQPSIGPFSSPTPEQIATALAAAFSEPAITVFDLMQAVDGAFQTPPPPITLDELATAAVFALNARPVTAGDVAAALHRIAPAATIADVAQALVAAYAPPLVIVPIEVGTALVQAFGNHATMTAVSTALIASFPTMKANVLAATLAQVYKLGRADVAPLLEALSHLPGLDAARAAIAVRPALDLPLTDATLLAAPLAQQFGLTQAPNDVAALGVAIFSAEYKLDVAAVAFEAVFSPWNGFDYGRLASVYLRPEWPIAIRLQSDGQTVTEAAPQIRKQVPEISSSDMALVLASVFDLTNADDGVTPVAHAMKAAGYPLSETAVGMCQFFMPWTADDFGRVLQVYQ